MRPHAVAPEDQDRPEHWLGSTLVIDVNEPRLRIKASSLTQLAKDEREKAMILHDFVKRMPIRARLRQARRTARQVLDARRGNAVEKTSLFIALLRAVGIPARLHYIEVGGNLLRGLVPYMTTAYRPLAEVWVGERWVKVDTHIFDAAYVAAARQRLRDGGYDFGYGIARDGHTMWNGRDDAYIGSIASGAPDVLHADLGVFDDDEHFLASEVYLSRHSRMGREARWSVIAPFMNKVMAELRAEGQGEAPLGKRAGT